MFSALWSSAVQIFDRRNSVTPRKTIFWRKRSVAKLTIVFAIAVIPMYGSMDYLRTSKAAADAS